MLHNTNFHVLSKRAFIKRKKRGSCNMNSYHVYRGLTASLISQHIHFQFYLIWKELWDISVDFNLYVQWFYFRLIWKRWNIKKINSQLQACVIFCSPHVFDGKPLNDTVVIVYGWQIPVYIWKKNKTVNLILKFSSHLMKYAYSTIMSHGIKMWQITDRGWFCTIQ